MPKPSNSPLFLAVDAGGTKAEFLLADADSALARARTESIKTLNASPAIAARNLLSGLNELEQRSGRSMREVVRTCIGASGIGAPAVEQWLRDQHAQHVAGELILLGDEEIAFDAAFRGGRGVLALAGTGSNVLGRTADRTPLSAGGWGPVLGDEGSGHWIGLEAVRAIFRTLDDDGATTLLDAVLSHWQLASVKHLVQHGNAAAAPRFAELAPLVVQCAAAGDTTASAVLQHAGEELARMVAVVIGKMEGLERDAFAVPEVAVAGSILESVPAVRNAMRSRLQSRWPRIVVHEHAVDAVQGALWRARQTHTPA